LNERALAERKPVDAKPDPQDMPKKTKKKRKNKRRQKKIPSPTPLDLDGDEPGKTPGQKQKEQNAKYFRELQDLGEEYELPKPKKPER